MVKALIKGTHTNRHPTIVSPNATMRNRSQSVRFSDELLPVHSPLLRQSQLISFPLLINMLKFSKYSNLTSACKMKNIVDKRIQRITYHTTTIVYYYAYWIDQQHGYDKDFSCYDSSHNNNNTRTTNITFIVPLSMCITPVLTIVTWLKPNELVTINVEK